MEIKEIIKSFRLELCVSRAELAELIGVERSCVCCWEKGTRSPNFKNIRKILKIAKANKIKLNANDFLDSKV